MVLWQVCSKYNSSQEKDAHWLIEQVQHVSIVFTVVVFVDLKLIRALVVPPGVRSKVRSSLDFPPMLLPAIGGHASMTKVTTLRIKPASQSTTT